MGIISIRGQIFQTARPSLFALSFLLMSVLLFDSASKDVIYVVVILIFVCCLICIHGILFCNACM